MSVERGLDLVVPHRHRPRIQPACVQNHIRKRPDRQIEQSYEEHEIVGPGDFKPKSGDNAFEGLLDYCWAWKPITSSP